MREILFRGKRPGGIWAYGYYFARPVLDQAFILCGEEQWSVDPTTAGQYTGREDKNSVKIFEGDILEFQFDDIGRQLAYVKWNDDYASFNVVPLNDFEYVRIYEGAVVGNIHDNPELLEEGDER